MSSCCRSGGGRLEEGAPIVREGGPPAWLTGQFPEHKEWLSWRACSVRVDEHLGAGLELEATASGYRVDDVEPDPGQPEELRKGSLIVSIDGFPLFGLLEEDLEEAFGARLRDKVEVQLLDWAELCEAEAARNAADVSEPEESGAAAAAALAEELSLDGCMLRQPAGIRVLRTLARSVRDELEADLGILQKTRHVVAELLCPPTTDMDSIVLRGEPAAVRAAKVELQDILRFYGMGPPEV